MNCIACQAPIDLAAKHCGACGVAIDADGDGVPDVLAKMIEDKARALLASERAREAEAAAAAGKAKASEDAATAARAALASYRAELASARDGLEANLRKPRSLFFVNKLVVTIIVLLSLVVGAAIFPGCVEPIAGRTVIAGPLLCPGRCAGCRGPGRVFTWHESGGSYEGNVSAQICHNAEVDVDRMTWQDGATDDTKLVAYRVSMWWSVPLDFALVLVVLFLLFPLYAARFRAKQIANERIVFEGIITTNEALLARLDPRRAEPQTYRG